MTDQIQILFPEGKEIILKESVFIIKPFTFGQLPKVIKAITKASKTFEEIKMTQNSINPADALSILSESGDELVELLADILKVEKSFIEDLEMDEAVELITAFFEVNTDFFTKRVVPLLQKALKK